MCIIVGCCDAGKTTAACFLLPDVFATIEKINADEIVCGLHQKSIDTVAFAEGKTMLQKTGDLISTKKTLLFK